MTRTDVVAHCLPGDHHALVWPGGAALLDGSVPSTVAAGLWWRMRRTPELGAFLQALAEASGSGLLDLPAFVVALHQGDRFHVAVRGEGQITAILDAGVDTLTGAGITTWAEKSLPLPVCALLTMRDEAGEEDASPMVDGVTRARAVRLGEVSESSDERPPAMDDQGAEGDGAEDVRRAEDDRHSEDDRRAEDSPAVVVPTPQPVPPSPAPPPPAPRPEPPAAPSPPPVPAPASVDSAPRAQPSPEPASAVTTTAANPYWALWDKTTAVDVEAAAVRVDADGAPVSDDAVPPAADSVDDDADADLDDQRHADTVLDEGFADIAAPVEPAAPQVLSRFCAQGHANPPERSQCFTCESAVVGEARRARRPQLGWLRVEGGETIPLNGPVVAGRNPSSAALRLSEPARLVALPHPHVSGTHVAFVIEGWRVMVHDLGSRNGTYLRRHGKPPVRLPAAPYLLVPGDLIDLGKGLFLHLDRIP